ncbi:MAG: pseudaminic acid synthase [Pseudomonadota bacterium]
MQKIIINNVEIGENCKPYIVAELSGNHQQDYQLAEQMIEAAAIAGVDAIKLQTYTADTMTLDCQSSDFIISETDSLWHGDNLHQLYQKAATPWEWHEALFKKSQSLGMCAFSSPFDASAVDFLETLDVPCYKIASFENNDLPLIKKVAQTGKPIIISTGMATKAEIQAAITTIEQQNNFQIIILKCTSNYPANALDSNLITIKDMQAEFNYPIGLSDHSIGNTVALASVALGACLLEKHFVLDKNAGGVDAEFSIDAKELASLVKESKKVFNAVGKVVYGGTENEQLSKKYRRSIYISEDAKMGDILTNENIKIVRPGFGLEPKHFSDVLGKKLKQSVTKGTALSWDLIS